MARLTKTDVLLQYAETLPSGFTTNDLKYMMDYDYQGASYTQNEIVGILSANGYRAKNPDRKRKEKCRWERVYEGEYDDEIQKT